MAGKVLITGASGVIGQRPATALCAEGRAPRCLTVCLHDERTAAIEKKKLFIAPVPVLAPKLSSDILYSLIDSRAFSGRMPPVKR